MKVVKLFEPTTLALDMYHMPFAVLTAKSAFYNMLKGRGVGIDADGNRFSWEDMVKQSVAVFPDNPCLRSAHNVWPIPTTFVANHRFFYQSRKCSKVDKNHDGLPPLKEVYDFYDGICCYCYEKIKHLSEASRDHHLPRSKGGGGGYKNIVLMHKDCNSNLGNQWPKTDKFGHDIVPEMRIYPSHFMLPKGVPMRPEWMRPLFLE